MVNVMGHTTISLSSASGCEEAGKQKRNGMSQRRKIFLFPSNRFGLRVCRKEYSGRFSIRVKVHIKAMLFCHTTLINHVSCYLRPSDHLQCFFTEKNSFRPFDHRRMAQALAKIRVVRLEEVGLQRLACIKFIDPVAPVGAKVSPDRDHRL